VAVQREARWLLHTTAVTVHHKNGQSSPWPGPQHLLPHVGSVTFEEGTYESITLPVETVRGVRLFLRPDGQTGISLTAGFRETFLFTLVSALYRLAETYQEGLARLRYCLDQSCGRLFLADHGRQEFCSPQCSRRTRVLRFREGQQQEQSARQPGVQKRRTPRPRGRKEGGKATE
jgi:hypothetical protein